MRDIRTHSVSSVLALAALLVLCLGACLHPSRAFAGHLVPDMDARGSITVSMLDPEAQEPVAGGTLTLFKVGTVHEDDGNFSFVLTEDFAASGESLASPEDADLAVRLAAYADDAKIGGATRSIASDGTVTFENVDLGLYLLVQNDAAKGYYPVSPFMVSVPVEQDGSYVYNVDATPKMELLARAPEEPGEPVRPAAPGGDMPQTGDLFSPVLVAGIAVLGAACVVVAVRIMRRRKR